MHSLNRLYLRTAGGREFVLCAANSLPSEVVLETPAECLWRLREAARYGQILGVRSFLARDSLVSVLGYPSDGGESLRVLEDMIERRLVAGYFPEGDGPGASLGGGLGSGAQPVCSFPESEPIEDLLAYAQSFAGRKAARHLSSSSPPRRSLNPPAMSPPTTPDSGFETVAENGPTSDPSPPGDLVAVVTQFLGTGTANKANKPDMEPESETEDGSSSELPLLPVEESCAAEEPVPIKLRFKLLDLTCKPVSDANVSVAGTDKPSDGTGLIDVEVKAVRGHVSADLPSGAVGLDIGAFEPMANADAACKIRLFNMGFLWDLNVEATDDEMTIAVEDFQAEYKIEVTGKLDDATKAKLVEVYGC